MLTIQRAKQSDVSAITKMMQEASALLSDSSWYVADDEDFVRCHIKETGFILNAFWDGTIAGFLMVRLPEKSEDNLGYSLLEQWTRQHLDPETELFNTAHMESVVVRPPFRGHHIQRDLIAKAISILKEQHYRHLMATVHPENKASLISFQKNGFQIIETVKKYGGLSRHILYRSI